MVFFDMGSSTLSPQAQGTLQSAAPALKTGPVAVTGYTDTVGSPQYNVILSQRRADAVAKSLVANGVPAASITTAGRGEQGLLVPTADNVAEPQNRRVEVVGTAMAAAPFNEEAYCKALAAKVRTLDRGTTPLGDIGRALAQCQSGGPYAQAIPVLEKELTDAKVPLPPRS
jgi:hypothetical protein